jgi:Zn finger protein HypA/HybF involved in hydrogenase expression
VSAQIPIEDIQDMIEDNVGYCSACEDFTTDSVEPDAQEYTCDVCGQDTVYGAEQALLIGLIG